MEVQKIRDLQGADDVFPHSIEAEQQLLGALLTDNNLFHHEQLKITAEDFFDAVHARIFDAIKAKVSSDQLASPVTLKSAFESDTGLKELGGAKYLIRLAGSAISSWAIGDYSQVIRDAADKRRLIGMMDDARERIATGTEPAQNVAQGLETATGALLSVSESKPLIRSHLSAMMGAVTQINDAYMNKSPIGVSTGLPQLDAKIGSLRPTNLIVLAGRPAMGKTSVAQNIAYSAAKQGHTVFFASLEMSAEELGMRFISKGLAEAGREIEYSRMIAGRISEDEMRATMHEAKRQEALPIIIGERDVRKISRLRAAAKRAQQQMADSACPLGLIVVDYVQRVDSDKPLPIRERVTAVTDALKSMAMDFGVPVVALAQLNREIERRDNKRPFLADLKESGSLEEDADVVLFCYRHAYYVKKEIEAMQGSEDLSAEADLRAALDRYQNDIEIIVGKQRSGAEGTVKAFIKPGLCHITQDRAGEAEMLV